MDTSLVYIKRNVNTQVKRDDSELFKLKSNSSLKMIPKEQRETETTQKQKQEQKQWQHL